MPAYIIQDVYTGYIWGDTRDIDGRSYHAGSIGDACRELDKSIGNFGREYSEVSQLSGDSGYRVYRVDAEGSEAVTVVWDGQCQETIEAVKRDCTLIGYVEYADDATYAE